MSSTPAVYPTSLVTFTTKVNHVDVVNDDDCNKLQNEVIALQTYIGTNPQGSKSNLTTRLAQLMATNGAINQGSAFPTSPVEGQLFWRTDLITMYVYGNSTWNSQGQSLSNVLYSWNGVVSSTVNTTGGIYSTALTSKLKKISGVGTITFYSLMSSNTAGNGAVTRVTIGGLAATCFYPALNGTVWAFNTLDISSLIVGTVYDIIVEITELNSDTTSRALEGLIFFGS